MKLKVCGMKYAENIEALKAIKPDYMGLIFHPQSSRFAGEASDPEIVKDLPEDIKVTGVFVNESRSYIQKKIDTYGLSTLQLHGDEPADEAAYWKNKGMEVFKVFKVGQNDFDFTKLAPYTEVVDWFLFDAQGDQPGGNGYPFNWETLHHYPFKVPFFLSGGLGPESTEAIEILQKNLNHSFLQGVDINSQFEIEPGLKNMELVKKFKEELIVNS